MPIDISLIQQEPLPKLPTVQEIRDKAEARRVAEQERQLNDLKYKETIRQFGEAEELRNAMRGVTDYDEAIKRAASLGRHDLVQTWMKAKIEQDKERALASKNNLENGNTAASVLARHAAVAKQNPAYYPKFLQVASELARQMPQIRPGVASLAPQWDERQSPKDMDDIITAGMDVEKLLSNQRANAEAEQKRWDFLTKKRQQAWAYFAASKDDADLEARLKAASADPDLADMGAEVRRQVPVGTYDSKRDRNNLLRNAMPAKDQQSADEYKETTLFENGQLIGANYNAATGKWTKADGTEIVNPKKPPTQAVVNVQNGGGAGGNAMPLLSGDDIEKRKAAIPQQYKGLLPLIEAAHRGDWDPQGSNTRTGQRALIESLAYQVYGPKGYSSNRFQVKKSFENPDSTTGKIRQSVNMTLSHMEVLQKAAEALNNGNLTYANQMFNALSDRIQGKPQIKTYEAAVEAVAREADRMFRGTGQGAQAGIDELRAVAKSSLSPAQFQGLFDTWGRLILGRMEAAQDQYQTEFGDDPDPEVRFFRMLSPESVRIASGMPLDLSRVVSPSQMAAIERAKSSGGSGKTKSASGGLSYSDYMNSQKK